VDGGVVHEEIDNGQAKEEMQALRDWNQRRWSLVAAFRDSGALTNFGTNNRHRYPRKRPQAKKNTKARDRGIKKRSGALLRSKPFSRFVASNQKVGWAGLAKPKNPQNQALTKESKRSSATRGASHNLLKCAHVPQTDQSPRGTRNSPLGPKRNKRVQEAAEAQSGILQKGQGSISECQESGG